MLGRHKYNRGKNMNNNQSPYQHANSPIQWYDFVLCLGMELAWGDSENVMEVLSVRRSNRQYFRNLQNQIGGTTC